MVDNALRTFAILASLIGLGWLWATIDLPEMLLAKVIVVGVLWAVWIAVVMGATALLALFLGMLGFVTKRK
jgi:hypothetical protein